MVGKMPVNVNDLNIDLASISSHKVRKKAFIYLSCDNLSLLLRFIFFLILQIYGPKGVGALYMRRRPRVRLEPLFSGGGQERGLRSGTLSPPLCVGMGAAARICVEDLEHDTKWIEYLSEKFKK
jgi:cysteine desulfurase